MQLRITFNVLIHISNSDKNKQYIMEAIIVAGARSSRRHWIHMEVLVQHHLHYACSLKPS